MREPIGGVKVAERVRALLGDGDSPAPLSPGAPEAPQRVVRWQPSRRATIALAAMLVLVGAVTLGWVMSARPQPLTIGDRPAAAPSGRSGGIAATPLPTVPAGTAMPSGTAATPLGGEVVIDVAGKVRRPGLYRLAPGARIYDALKVAGGALPGVDLISLNLAAKVSDGQQILVGVAPAPGAATVSVPGGGATAPSGGTSGLVDLNTADLTTLQDLPGVGPVTAQHILDWRAEHGSFASVDQLQDVAGIGPAKFAAMKPKATL